MLHSLDMDIFNPQNIEGRNYYLNFHRYKFFYVFNDKTQPYNLK